jgi:hypothetical protein
MPQGRLWLMSHLSAVPNGAQPPIPVLALGVLDIAAEVNGHAGLIAHRPRIVAGFDGGDITRADLTLLSTVRLDAQPAREAVQEVRRLAAIGPCKRLQVLRPPPAGLVCHVQDRVPCDVH